ncbi:uncharacterized protein METZ01_LOCUS149314 [marine metagenome]|uniref:Uncharacterized protein n=1 Tax=marine metagenome TaxID=408172 RepID=A0A382A4K9_9ZZZZ
MILILSPSTTSTTFSPNKLSGFPVRKNRRYGITSVNFASTTSGIIFIPPELITLSNRPNQRKDDSSINSTKSFVTMGLGLKAVA